MTNTEELLRLMENGKTPGIPGQEKSTDHLDKHQDQDFVDIDGYSVRTPYKKERVQQPGKSEMTSRTSPLEQSEMNHHHSIFLVLLLVSVLLFAFGLMLVA